MSRYARIWRKASELLEKAKIKTAPVDVVKIATMLGARIHYEPFPADDVCGLIHRRSVDDVVIGVNSLHAPTRKRFTIAHELGHMILDTDVLHVDARIPIAFRDEVSKGGTDPSEIAANQFAAALLMPAEFLAKDLAGKHVDLEDEDQVRKLAKKYEVSQQAMTIRLSNLGFGG